VRCQECLRAADEKAEGWRAYRSDEPGEPPLVGFYCPECAEREFGPVDGGRSGSSTRSGRNESEDAWGAPRDLIPRGGSRVENESEVKTNAYSEPEDGDTSSESPNQPVEAGTMQERVGRWTAITRHVERR